MYRRWVRSTQLKQHLSTCRPASRQSALTAGYFGLVLPGGCLLGRAARRPAGVPHLGSTLAAGFGSGSACLPCS